MLSFVRKALSHSLFSFVLCALVTTTGNAQSPCVQSPEGFQKTSQSECPRCRPSLCDFSCFSCEEVTAAASSCNRGKSCSTSVTIPGVSMTVGTERPNNCVAGGLAWGMRNVTGTAAAIVTCVDGKVTSIESVIFSTSSAQATGSSCGWSYRNLNVTMTWSAGSAPSLSITGWPNGGTQITDLAATANGAHFSLTGKAAAPLAGGAGLHHHAAVDLQLPVTTSCSCN